MIPVKHIDPEDLPLFAMQLLPPEEMEEMALMLQHSMEARRQLADIYGDLSLLGHSTEMHDPPALARQRFIKQVAREKKPTPVGAPEQYLVPQTAYAPRGAASSLLDEEPAERSFGEKAIPWVGWLIAAGIGAFSFILIQQNGELKSTVATEHSRIQKIEATTAAASALMETLKDPTAMRVTLVPAQTRPMPSGRVTYVASRGSLVFLASNLYPLQPYKTYELWVIPADGSPSLPAGLFKPDENGNASVVLPELAKGIEAKAFGVTIEDAEGSPTPTAPIVLAGSTS